MTDAEKAYQYFVIAVPENEEQAKAYFWARKALQSTFTPPNKALTQEELREMDGQPVWCEYIGDITFPSQWMIVECEMQRCSSGQWDLPFEDEPDDAYGETWLAYRRPPEGEEDI